MNDIQKKNVCDILDSSGSDFRKALDVRFRDLNLGNLRLKTTRSSKEPLPQFKRAYGPVMNGFDYKK
jgi:hypothetical protein